MLMANFAMTIVMIVAYSTTLKVSNTPTAAISSTSPDKLLILPLLFSLLVLLLLLLVLLLLPHATITTFF